MNIQGRQYHVLVWIQCKIPLVEELLGKGKDKEKTVLAVCRYIKFIVSLLT